MFTILYPVHFPEVAAIPGGLVPFHDEEDGYLLAIKVPKEYILAAKINGNFKIFVVPLRINKIDTCALMTGFFDDAREPLMIRTMLFNEAETKLFKKMLSSGEVKVFFFDEHAREHLNYNAKINMPYAAKKRLDRAVFLAPSTHAGQVILDAMDRWFAQSTAKDDGEAITIELGASVYGDEGLVILDATPGANNVHGAKGFSHTTLERKEPGSYQEQDIVSCLVRLFSPHQIYLNPLQTGKDREEMCDILVVTEDRLLIIQAKDSPNTEKVSKQTIDRKRANVIHALKKAINQVKGAASYLDASEGKLEFYIGDELHQIDVSGMERTAVIMVKELFNDTYKQYSEMLFELKAKKNINAVALDYAEFNEYTASLDDGDAFFSALDQAIDFATAKGEFPRMRFRMDTLDAERKR